MAGFEAAGVGVSLSVLAQVSPSFWLSAPAKSVVAHQASLTRRSKSYLTNEAVEFGASTSRLPRSNSMRIATPVFRGSSPSCMDGDSGPVNWNDNLIVSSGCGFLAERFNVLNESATTWQYFERSGYTFGSRQGNLIGNCGVRQRNIQTKGIFIRTNEGHYYVSMYDAELCEHSLSGAIREFRGGCRGNWLPVEQ